MREERLEQVDALLVGPLQVVEHQHDRLGALALIEHRPEPVVGRPEQLAARRGGLLLVPRRIDQHAERVEDPRGRAQRVLDRLTPGLRPARERQRQRVDRPVERDEGEVLALIAAPAQTERARLGGAADEVPGQRALADAALALDQLEADLARVRAREERLEPRELTLATDEG